MVVEGEQESRASDTAQTRGFLFADIRGYTDYLERRGAAAAAALLARYRAIVRATVAEHRGAEIRTEGDSFYVVLPTASAAVRCALSIVERVEAENAREPANAIRVGIGIHAGEAIDTEEGLVGSAVNIAARLSAIARPGEVLMSDTVRALTRSVIPVRYIPRGRHRLKGVAEPQEIFAAVPSDTTVSVPLRRGRPSVIGALAAAAVLGLVLILVYIVWPAGVTPGANPGASDTPAAPSASNVAYVPPSTAPPTPSATIAAGSPSLPGPTGPTIIHIDPDAYSQPYRPLLTAGWYRFDSFRPIVAFTVDPSWTNREWSPDHASSDYASLIGLPVGSRSFYDETGAIDRGILRLSFVRLSTVAGNPCDPGDTSSYQLLGGRPRDVVDWLSNHRFLATTNLQPVSFGGFSGFSVDVTVKGDPGMVCAGLEVPHQGVVWVFKTSSTGSYNGLYAIHDGEEAQFTILDIGGDAPLVFISAAKIESFSSVLPWSGDLMATITITTP